ncbi:MAG: ParB/Srx family N-terminal domain-containing protein [Spongiibacteraceae bacterium]
MTNDTNDQTAVTNGDTTESQKKKRRLGGARQRPGEGAIQGLATAINEMANTDTFLQRNQIDVLFLKPADIKKTFNARFVPCTLDEFSSISWPSLELDADSAKALYPDLLQDSAWYTVLSSKAQAEFLEFLGDIHIKAQSILSSQQIQPITAERKDPDSKEAYIIDGERRTLSVLYSKGAIPYIKAQIFGHSLSDAERAKLKDEANLFAPLKAAELIDSKLARIIAEPRLMEMPVRSLGTELKINRNYVTVIKGIYTHHQRDKLLSRIRAESLVWDDVRYLMEHGVDAIIPRQQGVSPTATEKTAAEKIKTAPVVSKLTEQLSSIGKRMENSLGYKCRLSHNPRKSQVKVTINCPQEQLDKLLESLGINVSSEDQ